MAIYEKQYGIRREFQNIVRVLIVLLCLGLTATIAAQDEDYSEEDSGYDAGNVGFQSDFLKVFDTAADKINGLAAAVPAEKYDWRPAEGVRSVKESLMHIAGASYFFASRLGSAMPEGMNPRELEKTVKTKEEAQKVLKQSFEHVRAAVEGVAADDLDTEITIFGSMNGSKRTVVLIVGDHMAEHLGQMIAYARMNGITPPWSQSQGE